MFIIKLGLKHRISKKKKTSAEMDRGPRIILNAAPSDTSQTTKSR